MRYRNGVLSRDRKLGVLVSVMTGTFGLVFCMSPAHACSYLPNRQAVTVFLEPDYPRDRRVYTVLSQNGFRRSGQHIYRPRCPGCDACIPVRVRVAEFQPRRSQRRAWQKNRDLGIKRCGPSFRFEHFSLFQRYLVSRHPGGGMDDLTPRQYLDFLTSRWCETDFWEFRLGKTLLAVAVLDRLEDGLSAVYTFFDPDYPQRSLGVFTVLWSIQQTRRQGLDWLYLGYWIPSSPKMRYKCEYQPQEHLRDGRWMAADNIA